MEEAGMMTNSSSSDSEIKTASNCVNSLEPEERLAHCGLVTLALVNCQGSSQKQKDRKDKDNEIDGKFSKFA